MAEFILHTSVTMAWCFEDEANEYADAVLDRLSAASALAPSIWPLEVGNLLVVAERREIMTESDSTRFVNLLRQLPIDVDPFSEQRILESVVGLAREHALSTYRASYLDLAVQTRLPLATLDQALQKAASRCNVPLYQQK